MKIKNKNFLIIAILILYSQVIKSSLTTGTTYSAYLTGVTGFSNYNSYYVSEKSKCGTNATCLSAIPTRWNNLVKSESDWNTYNNLYRTPRADWCGSSDVAPIYYSTNAIIGKQKCLDESYSINDWFAQNKPHFKHGVAQPHAIYGIFNDVTNWINQNPTNKDAATLRNATDDPAVGKLKKLALVYDNRVEMNGPESSTSPWTFTYNVEPGLLKAYYGLINDVTDYVINNANNPAKSTAEALRNATGDPAVAKLKSLAIVHNSGAEQKFGPESSTSPWTFNYTVS